MDYFKNILIPIVLTGLFLPTFGQMHISPLSREMKSGTVNGRTESTPLQLPFWDDFSVSYGVPNPELWINSENIFVGSGMSIAPPTIHSATFDGVDAVGDPYSLDPLADGPTDRLTSQPIDLAVYAPTDKIFMGFFFQAKGEGEVPNPNDSLRLEFKKKDGTWKKKWAVSGGEVLPDTFVFVSLSVVDTNFFHSDFQFRFTSYGRQSGPFDTWHLDYVYLNKGVTKFDFPDRALQSTPTTIFKGYTAVPIHHFKSAPESYLSYSTARAYNLFDSLQPANFTLLADLKSTMSDSSVVWGTDTLSFKTASSFPDPLRTGTRSIGLTSENLLNPALIITDSLCEITLTLFMNTDDNQPPDYQPQYEPLDFRVNDTIRTKQVLHDFYAYDDGQAEFGAGLNYPGDFVAYRFPMAFPGKDTLVSIDMYFPDIGGESGSRIIELFVWAKLRDNSNIALHQQTLTVKPTGLNEFFTYALSEPVLVQDTFYVGWRQTQVGNLDVGLDKNNDTGKNIFFNLEGTWQQNTQVKGSLMIRPRFGKADIILGLEESLQEVNLFPNPGQGNFTISGKVEEIRVYNMQGQMVLSKDFDNSEDVHNFTLDTHQNGMYIVRMISGRQTITRKLILRR